MGFFDRFRYLDGKIIDFTEYYMETDFNFNEEDITMPDGITPAKVYTLEQKSKYLDRDFYGVVIDTVFQYTPENK
jgi:hypothetical protein